jgi:hypothetical protein
LFLLALQSQLLALSCLPTQPLDILIDIILALPLLLLLRLLLLFLASRCRASATHAN